MKQIAIFASGSGTNAEKFFEYFKDSSEIEISLLLSNKAEAYAITRAKNHGVDSLVFSRNDFYQTENVLEFLRNKNIDFIVLAGFLWLIPNSLISNFPDKIINIHPALLPKYGGKGMYGMRVHEEVKKNQEKESGVTIHLVNEVYDDGKIISQHKVEIDPSDSAEDIANKIHELEYAHFPIAVEGYIKGHSN